MSRGRLSVEGIGGQSAPVELLCSALRTRLWKGNVAAFAGRGSHGVGGEVSRGRLRRKLH